MIEPMPMKTPVVTILPDGRMDTRNTAIYTGFAEKTLAMMRCNGTGPKFVKLGRVFYFQEDLDAWLQRGRVVSTAQAQQLASV
jgi:hypothetical protein